MVTQKQMATALRFLSADMIEQAHSGHPGMPLGMADIATVLWTKFLRFDVSHPHWFDRDRFVLSNGHGSALLYALFYVLGYEDISQEQLKKFRQFGSRTAGHPERNLAAGVDYSTGPLGQGLAAAVGMALAEKMLNARFGDDLVNHKTYAFVGDGCLMEGLSEEAISLAGHWRLNKLIVLWDDNAVTIDGATTIATSTDMKQRFEANGWSVLTCNGHDFDEIEKALSLAQESDRPVFIDCKTVIGFGATGKSGTPACHGAPLGTMEIEAMRRTLEWPYKPFEVPAEILQVWRLAGYRNEGARRQWEDRVARDKNKNDFEQMISGKLPTDFDEQMVAFEQKLIQQLKPMASRKSSQTVLSELVRIVPNLVGGSADLTAANYTNTPDSVAVTHYNYAGNYVNYGIREHAMGAIMNGLAAHGGFIPYGGTFLSFSDYMKPAIRLAALMRLHVLYVFTHDSIGVGEDGPTHQPVEQLVSLRAVPNLYVFRPADTIETAECYACALRYEGPSALVFSRQELPVLRTIAGENQSAKGAYVLYEPARARDITLIATGSEVGLAMATKDILEKNGLHVAVVSMPCMELFARQSDKYRHAVLGQAPRMSIEAASSIGWDRWVGDDGVSIGLDDFGVSAPAKELFSHFGFIPEALAERAMRLLK